VRSCEILAAAGLFHLKIYNFFEIFFWVRYLKKKRGMGVGVRAKSYFASMALPIKQLNQDINLVKCLELTST